MPQEITSQADYYGLPQTTLEAGSGPLPHIVEQQLRPAVPWSGPLKVDKE
jgi:hypothetical protein